MENRSRPNRGSILIRALLILSAVLPTSCSQAPKYPNAVEKTEVTPCFVWPDDITRCRAVPLNENLPMYDRPVSPGDTVLKIDDWVLVQKLLGGRCE